MPRAYLISDVTAKDRDAFDHYRTHAAAAIARFGGRYLVRGGTVETLEGEWRPSMVVIVEFPDIEAAQAWYRSPDYADALRFRDAALTRDLILVEGIELP